MVTIVFVWRKPMATAVAGFPCAVRRVISGSKIAGGTGESQPSAWTERTSSGESASAVSMRSRPSVGARRTMGTDSASPRAAASAVAASSAARSEAQSVTGVPPTSSMRIRGRSASAAAAVACVPPLPSTTRSIGDAVIGRSSAGPISTPMRPARSTRAATAVSFPSRSTTTSAVLPARGARAARSCAMRGPSAFSTRSTTSPGRRMSAFCEPAATLWMRINGTRPRMPRSISAGSPPAAGAESACRSGTGTSARSTVLPADVRHRVANGVPPERIAASASAAVASVACRGSPAVGGKYSSSGTPGALLSPTPTSASSRSVVAPLPSGSSPAACIVDSNNSRSAGAAAPTVAEPAGSIPMARSPVTASLRGVTVKCISRGAPPASVRTTAMSIDSPGRAMAPAIWMSAKVWTGVPSIETSASPARRPGVPPSMGTAAAAGEPGITPPTTGASNRTPTMNARTKSATASTRLKVTPALTTTMRFHTGARW